MTTYRIVANHFVAAVVEDAGTVLQAAPILGWSVGRSFHSLRSYAEQNGWTVQPLPTEEDQVSTIKYGGATYEFFWYDGRIVRITQHSDSGSRDVAFSQLPKKVLDLI